MRCVAVKVESKDNNIYYIRHGPSGWGFSHKPSDAMPIPIQWVSAMMEFIFYLEGKDRLEKVTITEMEYLGSTNGLIEPIKE